MRLSRKDFVLVLAIVAGGAFGAFSLGALVFSSLSDDVLTVVLLNDASLGQQQKCGN